MPSPTKRRRLSTRRPGHPVRSTERSLDALVAHSPATTRLLLKLSKQALAGLALGWLDDPRTRPSKGTGRKGRRREGSDAGSRGSGEEDSEGEDDDPDDGPADRLKKLSLYYSEVSSISKPRLVERILLDWKRGLSPSQIADADVASYVEKPASGRSWTAFELVYASPTGSTSRAATVGEQELESRLQQVLEPSFAACHVQVSKPYPPPNSPLHVRLSLLSSSLTSSIAPKPTASPVVHLLHFPATPYVLLPPLPTSLVPTVHHALCAAFSRPPGRRASSTTDRGVVDSLKELQLKGKDWRGLRELLVEGAKGASGAEWKKFRTEEGKGNVPDGEDGEALAPKERRRSVDLDDARGPDYVSAKEADRIMMDDFGLKSARDKEVGATFGKSALPKLERITWQVPLASLFPDANGLLPADGEDDEPCFTLQLDGPSVLEGLRDLVSHGFTEHHQAPGPGAKEGQGDKGLPGVPEWMRDAIECGENVVEVERMEEDDREG